MLNKYLSDLVIYVRFKKKIKIEQSGPLLTSIEVVYTYKHFNASKLLFKHNVPSKCSVCVRPLQWMCIVSDAWRCQYEAWAMHRLLQLQYSTVLKVDLICDELQLAAGEKRFV